MSHKLPYNYVTVPINPIEIIETIGGGVLGNTWLQNEMQRIPGTTIVPNKKGMLLLKNTPERSHELREMAKARKKNEKREYNKLYMRDKRGVADKEKFY